jgi:alcohol dehydrogenase
MSLTTRAALLPAVGARLEIAEVELDPPRDGEVLLKIHSSGVCHSDLNAVDGIAVNPFPAVLGHEASGTLEAVGPNTTLTPGTRVILSWMPPCGTCEPCVRDLPHLCRVGWGGMWNGLMLDGTSRLRRNGEPIWHYCRLSTFAEWAVVSERSCVPVAPDVGMSEVALIGCAVTTGVGAVWRTAGVRPGERVAVIGCGGIGMSAILGAVAAGAYPIIAVDIVSEKLEAAMRLGATHAVEWQGSAEETAERITEVSGGGVDYAFEATGRPEAMAAATVSTRERGAAVLMGIAHEGAVFEVPARKIPRFERRIMGATYGSSKPTREFQTIVDLYRAGRLPLDRLISHRLPLEAAQEAFDLVRSGTALRVVLEISQ